MKWQPRYRVHGSLSTSFSGGNIFGPCSTYQTISEIRLVVNLANIQTWIGDCSKDYVDIIINIFYK